MAKKKLHTAEEQHAAMDKIGGFTYQFYCFLLHLLKMERGETVSFEKLDDAAIEKGNLITLYQAKHSVQVDANGETKALTNRSLDLWKAIDVWRELIVGKPGRTVDEQKAYIDGHKFCFVSNKPLTDNKVVALCKEVNNGIGTDRIDAVLEAITQEGKLRKDGENAPAYRTVQQMIDDLKSYELRVEFLKKVEFETKTQDEIEEECKKVISGSAWFDDEDAFHVFDDFFLVAVKDFFAKADIGEALSYSYKERKEKFSPVFAYHRDKPLDFRINIEKYKKDFLDLVCIQQLIKVKDFSASEVDEVAKHASYFYSFKNHYADLIEHSRILPQEEEAFMGEAEEFWDNEFKKAYRKCDDSTSEEEIVDKAQDILYEVRKHQLKLCKETLQQRISDGAFYYLSDECIIGWHRNWQEFFKKQTKQDGQAD